MNDTPTARAPVTDAIERLRGQLKVSDAYAADANKDQLASVWQLQNANLQFILRDLERALAHPPAAEREAPGGVVVPEGWKLVPVEPTDDIWAAFDYYNGDKRTGYDTWREAWAEMLAAAPPPSANIGGDSPSEREKALREALETFQSYGCPACGGDCASANPPVYCCPMQEARAALLATPAEGGGT